jgi:hypothetical protein
MILDAELEADLVIRCDGGGDITPTPLFTPLLTPLLPLTLPRLLP